MAWRGWWRWGVATIVVLLLAVPTAIGWIHGGLGDAPAVATILALLTIAGGVLAWAYRSSRGTTMSTPGQIGEAARTLASLVRQQWRDEVAIRLLTDPAPLTVRWKPVPELSDHLSLSGKLSGRTDDIERLADAFRRLPQRRLVILGGPGAGKTTLAVMLTLALCDKPSDRDPVPVLLATDSWTPASEPLHTWIKRRLAEDYDALRATVFGPNAIEGLVAGRRVLPVLDGLDELPEPSRREALVRIRQALADRDSLVVTCRTAEYRDIVTASDVITAAAVIEAEDVRLDDALDYLAQVVPPGRRSQQWQPLLDHLRAHRDGPLAAALSTPLMVSLLRTVYAEGHADPAPLIDRHCFPGRASIDSHLLDALVPTLIAFTRPGTTRHARAWDAKASQRWLSFLATHLNGLATRDLRWWHLYRHLPTRICGLIFGLIFGLMFGLGLGLLFFGVGSGLVVGLAVGLSGGLGVGLAVGLGVGLGSRLVRGLWGGLGDEPARANWRLRGRGRSLIRELGNWLVLDLVVVLLAVLLAVLLVRLGVGLGSGLGGNLVGSLVAALGFGLVWTLVTGLMKWLQVPSSDDGSATPLSTIQGTRTLVLATESTCALVGLVYALGLVVVFGSGPGPGVGLVGGLVSGLVVGLASGLLPGAWVPFVIVRLWLAVRRQLPWRLMAFLDDCHRLGILRQVGPVYQFRHARLQDHLARTPISPGTDPDVDAR